jgi:hypothetical protein
LLFVFVLLKPSHSHFCNFQRVRVLESTAVEMMAKDLDEVAVPDVPDHESAQAAVCITQEHVNFTPLVRIWTIESRRFGVGNI